MTYRRRRAFPSLFIGIALFIVPAASTAQSASKTAPPSTASKNQGTSRAATAAAQDFPEGTEPFPIHAQTTEEEARSYNDPKFTGDQTEIY